MDAEFAVEGLDVLALLAAVLVFLDAGASELLATKPSSETYSDETGAVLPDALVRLVPAMVVIKEGEESERKYYYGE